MFIRQNLVRISPDFPPRERIDPILPGHRMNNWITKTSKIEVDLREEVMDRKREGHATHNQSGFPMLGDCSG